MERFVWNRMVHYGAERITRERAFGVEADTEWFYTNEKMITDSFDDTMKEYSKVAHMRLHDYDMTRGALNRLHGSHMSRTSTLIYLLEKSFTR